MVTKENEGLAMCVSGRRAQATIMAQEEDIEEIAHYVRKVIDRVCLHDIDGTSRIKAGHFGWCLEVLAAYAIQSKEDLS